MDIESVNAESMARASAEILASDVRMILMSDPQLNERYMIALRNLAEFRIESIENELRQAGY
jgi:hypothetical protein